jgi:hypothetical protein
MVLDAANSDSITLSVDCIWYWKIGCPEPHRHLILKIK